MTGSRNQPEEKLSAALRELGASSRQGASPELGLILKGAFRTHHARRRRMRRMRLAILCICVAGLASSLLLRESVVKNMPDQAAVHTIPPQEVVPATNISVSKTGPAPSKKTFPHRNTPTAASAFVALPSFDMVSAADELRVVRLEMPGADLRLVGAPVTEKIARGRVTADFVVGHDGTPYAVRLVQSKF